ALTSEMFGVKPIVNWKILLHVGEKDGDIYDVIPVRTGVFQHEPHIFKYGATLFFDVVTQDITGGVKRDAGNFLAAANARSDSGKEEQVADTLGMWKCADRLGRARALECFAHPRGAYFSNFGNLESIASHGCASVVHMSCCGLYTLGSSKVPAAMPCPNSLLPPNSREPQFEQNPRTLSPTISLVVL